MEESVVLRDKSRVVEGKCRVEGQVSCSCVEGKCRIEGQVSCS